MEIFDHENSVQVAISGKLHRDLVRWTPLFTRALRLATHRDTDSIRYSVLASIPMQNRTMGVPAPEQVPAHAQILLDSVIMAAKYADPI